MKKRLVILTGAGMSAESGISTFRDSDGLWEKHRVEDVATPEGFAANPQLVLDFYNQRRRELLNTQPNAGHIGLAELAGWRNWSKSSTCELSRKTSTTCTNALEAVTSSTCMAS